MSDENTLEIRLKPELKDVSMPELWKMLGKGKGLREIKKDKDLEEYKLTDLSEFIEKLYCLTHDDCLVIQKSDLDKLFPMYQDKEKKWYRHSNFSFKRTGRVFDILRVTPNLKSKYPEIVGKKVTMGELDEYQIGPQELMQTAVKNALENNGLRIGWNIQNFYEKIARQGFRYDDGNYKVIISQDAINKGWRIASAYVLKNISLGFSNPKGGFYCELHPLSQNFGAKPVTVTLNGIMSSDNDSDNYGGWQRFRWTKSREDPDDETFAGRPRTQSGLQENHMNYQTVAALILRNHVTSKRTSDGKNLFESKTNNHIPDVKVNMIPIPKPLNARLDLMLANNVIVRYVTEKGEKKGRKLSQGERELIWSTHLWYHGFDNCYTVDDSFKSIDEGFATYEDMFMQNGLWRYNIK